ncbi:hypothetical protein D3C75_1376750 [compost metagenome]
MKTMPVARHDSPARRHLIRQCLLHCARYIRLPTRYMLNRFKQFQALLACATMNVVQHIDG